MTGEVSILVLVDVSLEAADENSVCQISSRFQSLFSWMFRSKITGVVQSRLNTIVSILVLVDVSLEDIRRH